MRQVEGRQVFVVERRPLAAIRIIGLEGRGGLWILHDGIHARPDLLHDPEIGIELRLDHLLRR